MKFKKFNRTYIFIIFLFGAAFFSRCAQPSVPTGGPKDTIPPILLGVTPANFSTNFDSREIVFRFNEYLQLKDVQKEVLFSPPFAVRPFITVKGKTIVLKFPPELKLDTNTTYKIDFGAAIADNNEGNPTKRFEYVFSTGKDIDSLVMSGKLVDAYTGADIINGFVFYYEDKIITSDLSKGDSTIFKGKKMSIARTDSTGNFLATNLKAIPYRVFAIKDENGNIEYDMGTDMVGLLNTRYNPETMKEFDVWIDPVKDRIEVTPQIKFELFKEQRRLAQNLKGVKRSKELLLDLEFAADSVVIESIVIDSVAKENIIIENELFNDSIRVWIRSVDTKLPDTLKGIIKYQSTDSIGRIKIDSSIFALNYVKVSNEKSGVDKVAEKLGNITNSFFKKFTDWVQRLFMGKKKKIALMNAAEKRFIADSLKKVSADSLLIIMRRDSILKADSISKLNLPVIKRDTNKIFKPSLSVSGDISPNSKVYLLSEYPLYIVDTSRIKIDRLSFKEMTEDDFDINDAELKDKKPDIITPQKYTIKRLDNDYTKWLIDIDWLPKSEYQVVINQDALMDIAGFVNDSIGYSIKTYDPAKYARVVVDVKLIDSMAKNSYIVSLMDSTNNIIDTKYITGKGKIIFDYLTIKKYKLKFVNDVNSNKIHDMGVVMKNIEPERVEVFYPRKGDALFPTKENWDAEFDIYPEKLFNSDLIVPEFKIKEIVVDSLTVVKEIKK